jgi:hypothetical protein
MSSESKKQVTVRNLRNEIKAFSTACILNPSVYFGLIFLSSKVYFRGGNYSDTGGMTE